MGYWMERSLKNNVNEKGGIAEYLMMISTRESMASSVRLNKGIRDMLTALIEESLENTSTMFPEEELYDSYEEYMESDDYEAYDHFMQSMQFIKDIIEPNAKRDILMPKYVAKTIYYWIIDHRNHHLSDEPYFDDAMSWVINHVSKRYAVTEFIN